MIKISKEERENMSDSELLETLSALSREIEQRPLTNAQRPLVEAITKIAHSLAYELVKG